MFLVCVTGHMTMGTQKGAMVLTAFNISMTVPMAPTDGNAPRIHLASFHSTSGQRCLTFLGREACSMLRDSSEPGHSCKRLDGGSLVQCRDCMQRRLLIGPFVHSVLYAHE